MSSVSKYSYGGPRRIESTRSVRDSGSSTSRMKAVSVADKIVKKGEVNVISLRDQEGGIPDGIEDITSDFVNISKGTIKTGIIPMVLNLTKDEHTKRVRMTTMKQIWTSMTKGVISNEKFIRFDKVQFFYVPLFSQRETEEDNGTITLGLHDTAATDDEVIQQVTINASEMAMVELSMDFFVYEKDVEKITVHIETEGVPISGRKYGSLNVAFYAHSETIPTKIDQKPSTVIYIDSFSRPKDINNKSVFNSLANKVTKELETKKEAYKKKLRENEKEKKKSKKYLDFDVESKSSSSSEGARDFMDAARKSISVLPNYLASQRDAPPPPIIEPLAPHRYMLPNGEDYLTTLDTGSADHFIHCERIDKTDVIKHIGGVEEIEVEKAECLLRTMTKDMVLKEVYMLTDRRLGLNILSYSMLRNDGHVDEMTTAGNSLFLKLKGEIVMVFDTSEEGRMWLKDSVWKEVTDNKRMSANAYSEMMTMKFK
nr:TPA_asm: movement protein [Chrysanthemum ophiovirus_indi]